MTTVTVAKHSSHGLPDENADDGVDDEEFHIDFSDDTRLEIWENKEAYGPKADAVKVYKNGAYNGSIVF